MAQPFIGSKAGGEFGLTETSVAFRCLRAWFIIFFWKKVRFLSNQLLVTFQPCTHSRPRYSMHNCKIVCFPFVPLNKIFNPLDLLDAKVKTLMPWTDSHMDDLSCQYSMESHSPSPASYKSAFSYQLMSCMTNYKTILNSSKLIENLKKRNNSKNLEGRVF